MHDVAYDRIFRGDRPILVAAPHVGTSVPDEFLWLPAWQSVQTSPVDLAGERFLDAAARLRISFIAPLVHPCVIDVNAAADSQAVGSELGRSMLCRAHSPSGDVLYDEMGEPTAADVNRRIQRYWLPYHEALRAELQRLRAAHGEVLLLVSHASSRLAPYRSPYRASDCNVGTNRGASCSRHFVTTLTQTVQRSGRSWVVNGQLSDSFVAQQYGCPADGIHVVDIEVAGKWRDDCVQPPAADTAEDEFGAVLASLLEALPTSPAPDRTVCTGPGIGRPR
ncbi:N-formylglutamate amidohydrolase [Burkholderia vietnamiensis]|uniref:N-formylglutamate amidohydrolase n=1 Tax=Burkholderia vietnamiensis TaxID=60552 RepID=UPI00264A947A|nr:N-formylglutamate amidohydrolase [Burkholderia vietnamiensis]MDN8035927.1 N-formylglutamate amidohydrolase [Burkholderia vietnamiensis]HDR8925053.1 N-formylglutamate amidohydrolase [Burkholderia vietnamiensis]HDR9215307.1 N-formylglutamate amidohydrolase [Burkholderia vietnamiensis]